MAVLGKKKKKTRQTKKYFRWLRPDQGLFITYNVTASITKPTGLIKFSVNTSSELDSINGDFHHKLEKPVIHNQTIINNKVMIIIYM